jgi:hypothetical protein
MSEGVTWIFDMAETGENVEWVTSCWDIPEFSWPFRADAACHWPSVPLYLRVFIPTFYRKFLV